MGRFWAGLGAINAFLAVSAGAFGAHALKKQLTPEALAVFETGARYHLFHALALLAISYLCSTGLAVDAAGWAFVAGIALFSGSLYALAISGVRGLGAITPLGGLCFLFGWAWVAWRCFKTS
jgi:uncharacterized membrane protein YgdD (TMEM256/DUF423 family)